MKNAIYGKAMEKLRNRVDVKLVNNEKDYLKCTPKSSYMSHKIFDNNLVGKPKCKLALKLNKSSIHWNVNIRIEQSINIRISL